VVGNCLKSYPAAGFDTDLPEPQFILEHNGSIEIFQNSGWHTFLPQKEWRNFGRIELKPLDQKLRR